MSKLKQLAGDTVLYGLGSMVPRMLNFLLLPVHTKNAFSPEQYGVLTQLYALVGFLNVVYMFGMETAFFRFSTKADANATRIYNLAQTAVLCISVFLSLSFVLLSWPISTALDVDPRYILWLTGVMFLDALVAIPFAKLRLQRKAIRFSLARIVNILVLVLLNIYFIKINKENYDPDIGIGYVFIANLIANGFYLLFVGKSLFSWRPAFDKEVLPAMVKYSFPIMLTGLAGMTNEMFSRFMLAWWLPDNFYRGRTSEYALGVFGACYKFAVFMNLAIQAFRFAAEPFFFSNALDKKSPQLFAQVNHYFIIVCCIFLLGVSINLDTLKYFFIGREYWQGLDIVPVLLLGYLFLGIYYNMSVWFKLTDKTYYGTFITVGGAILTVILNYALIPVAGYMGSSIATLVCYFSMTIACYLFGQKYYPIPYTVRAVTAYILITTALVYSVNYVSFESQWVSFMVNQIILGAYILVIYLIERRNLKKSFA